MFLLLAPTELGGGHGRFATVDGGGVWGDFWYF